MNVFILLLKVKKNEKEKKIPYITTQLEYTTIQLIQENDVEYTYK